MSSPTGIQTGNDVSKDSKPLRTMAVRFNEPSKITTESRVPTFARQALSKSYAPGDFAHHRDTFNVAKAYRRRGNKHQSIVPPQRIVISLLKYIDHSTYLSLRLVSRSWNRATDHAKPPQYPAIYKIPTNVIQQIYQIILARELTQSSCAILSVNDFNNARHSCRAWMAASLDREILARAFYQLGLMSYRSRLESSFQNLDDDDDDAETSILWEASLQLARCLNPAFSAHESLLDGVLHTVSW